MFWIIGADEVGLGPLAGPLMVGAVLAPADMSRPDGITDSKKLSEDARKKAHERLRGMKDIHRAVAHRSAEFLDTYGRQTALRECYEEAIDRLLDQGLQLGSDVTEIRIDGLPLVLEFGEHRPTFIVHGDLLDWYIGAASIVAKTIRDEVMIRLSKKDAYKEYLWAKNKGYGTKDHLEAIKRLGLSDQHRKSFCRRLQTPDTVDLFELFEG